MNILGLKKEEIEVLEDFYKECEEVFGDLDIDTLKVELDGAKQTLEEIQDNDFESKVIEELTSSDAFENFKKIYFGKEAKRIGDTLTATMPISKDAEQDLIDKLKSIRHFKLFLNSKSLSTPSTLDLRVAEARIEVVEKTLKDKEV